MQQTPVKRTRYSRTLPLCHHLTSSVRLERLATFAALCHCDISPIRLAGSGCVYNAEEEYVECINCGKIIKRENSMFLFVLFNLNF
jgi:hypothetical protein